MNINNNNAPFVSLTWLQKKRLGCVVYSHCPTKTHVANVYIAAAAAYLAIVLLSLLAY